MAGASSVPLQAHRLQLLSGLHGTGQPPGGRHCLYSTLLQRQIKAHSFSYSPLSTNMQLRLSCMHCTALRLTAELTLVHLL